MDEEVRSGSAGDVGHSRRGNGKRVETDEARQEAARGWERSAMGDKRGDEERRDARSKEILAEGGTCRGVGEDVLEEAVSKGGGERHRERREGGGEAAAAEATENSGEVSLRVERGCRSERADELRSICGGVGGG
jgi:hypothetical protein